MLLITGTTLNIQSFIGAIMAIGVAMANAILLVTFAETDGKTVSPANDAAIEGASSRLRAILMTSCAMIAGMLPMALGLGEAGQQNAPLGPSRDRWPDRCHAGHAVCAAQPVFHVPKPGERCVALARSNRSTQFALCTSRRSLSRPGLKQESIHEMVTLIDCCHTRRRLLISGNGCQPPGNGCNVAPAAPQPQSIALPLASLCEKRSSSPQRNRAALKRLKKRRSYRNWPVTFNKCSSTLATRSRQISC